MVVMAMVHMALAVTVMVTNLAKVVMEMVVAHLEEEETTMVMEVVHTARAMMEMAMLHMDAMEMVLMAKVMVVMAGVLMARVMEMPTNLVLAGTHSAESQVMMTTQREEEEAWARVRLEDATLMTSLVEDPTEVLLDREAVKIPEVGPESSEMAPDLAENHPTMMMMELITLTTTEEDLTLVAVVVTASEEVPLEEMPMATLGGEKAHPEMMTTSSEEDLVDMTDLAKVRMAEEMETTSMAVDLDVMDLAKVTAMTMYSARAHMAEVMELTSTEKDGKDQALVDRAMKVPAVMMITIEDMVPGTRGHRTQEEEVMVTAPTAPTTDAPACHAAHHSTAETRDTDAKVPDLEARMEPAVTTTTTDLADRVTTSASTATTAKALPSVAAVTTRKTAAGVSTTTETRRDIRSSGATAKICSDMQTSKKVRRRSTEGPRTVRETDEGRSSDAATATHFTATTTTSTGHPMEERTTRTVETEHFREVRYRFTAGLAMTKTADPDERDRRCTVMTLPAGGDHRSEVAAVAKAAKAAKTAHSSRSS